MFEKFPLIGCAAKYALPLLAVLFCAAMTAPGHAQTEPYYQGKTIRIIVGFTAGGLSDQWARMFARVMPKFIAGQPEHHRAKHARGELRGGGQFRLRRR